MTAASRPERPSNETLPLVEIPRRWAQCWENGQTPDLERFLQPFPHLPVRILIEVLRIDQRKRWDRGDRIPVEAYLDRFPVVREDEAARLELILGEYALRQELGPAVSAEEFCRRFPASAAQVRGRLAVAGGTGSSATRTTLGNDENPTAPGSSEPPSGAAAGDGTRSISNRLGRFEIRRKLGNGTFGRVYLAYDSQLDRLIALKVPRPGIVRTALDADRFFREARAAAQLKHPAIVPVYDAGQIQDIYYIAADFVEGMTLSEYVKTYPHSLSFRDIAQLILRIAEGLQAAHTKGIIHRDMKPTNVMIDRMDQPHIMDFGLARRDDGGGDISPEGSLIGTPAYMSPEQARGESHRADARSDIYSLGVMMYEMLTRQRPYQGKPREVLAQILREGPTPPRAIRADVPRDLEVICLKAMARDPEHRYPSAQHLADDLRRWLNSEPIQARKVPVIERIGKWVYRDPLRHGGVVAVIGLMIGVAGLAFWLVVSALNEAQRDRDRAKVAEGEARYQSAIARQAMRKAQDELERSQAAERVAREAEQRAEEKEAETRKALADATRARLLASTAEQRRAASEKAATQQQAAADQDKYQLLIDEARTARLSHEPGWNVVAAQKIAEAAGMHVLRPDPPVLRSEAMAAFFQGRRGSKTAGIHIHTSTVRRLAFNPSGALFASASIDRTIRVFPRKLAQDPARMVSDSSLLIGPTRGVQALAFRPPAGRWLAAAGDDQMIRFWDLAQLTAATPEAPRLGVISRNAGAITSMAFSPDGKTLIGGTLKGHLQVWDTARLDNWINPTPPPGSTRPLLRMTLHPSGGGILAVAFASDGQTYASGSANGAIRLWTLGDKKATAELQDHGGEVRALGFTPDGKTLVAGLTDGKIRAWSVGSLRQETVLKGHSREVRDLAFDGAGTILASGSADKSVRLWRPGTWEFVAAIYGDHAVWSVALSPDGKLLVTGHSDGAIVVRNLAAARQELQKLGLNW